jgi:Fe-S-cluster containining protein
MLPTLTIFLSVAILAMIVVISLTFFSVAFAGPNTASGAKWEPPRDTDDAMVHWAARMAASLTRHRLAMARTNTTAVELTKELYAGTSEALEKLHNEEGQCSARCHEMIGVLAPEALAVAADLRSQLGRTETDRIRRKAKANVVKTEAMTPEQYVAATVTCPLLSDEGTCAAYDYRPLFCRTDCAKCKGDQAATTKHTVSSAALARGIGRGLSKSLATAGVDANRYELNSALLVALDTPDASERWANGGAVFADCKQFAV